MALIKKDAQSVVQGQPEKKTSECKPRANRSNPAAGLSKLDFSAGYTNLRRRLIEELRPVGLIETHWVNTIAMEMIVRIPRAKKMEADFINEWSYEPDAPPLYEGLVEPRLRPQRDVIETLVRFHQRYESTCSSNLTRAIHELERAQRRRKGEAVPAPGALDINFHMHPKDNKEESLAPTIEQPFSESDDVVTI